MKNVKVTIPNVITVAHPPASAEPRLTVDGLANEIRTVDGSNSLGAGALAEALMPYLTKAANSLMNKEWPDQPNATQFIAYSDEMKARVLERMAQGAIVHLELTDELWKGERAVKI